MSSETLSFGEWLDDQLRANRLSQNAFAAMIDSNSGSVSRWVNNHRTPDPDTCYRIAAALGEDPLEVLVRAGHVDEGDSEVRRMRAAKEAEEAYQQAARAVERISHIERNALCRSLRVTTPYAINDSGDSASVLDAACVPDSCRWHKQKPSRL